MAEAGVEHHNHETTAGLAPTAVTDNSSSPSATIPTASECSTPTNVPLRASPSLNSSPASSLSSIGPMLYDPTLPPGWSRRVTQRTMGASAGKYDVYIYSPDRKKIRSKTDLIIYLARNNLDLDPDSFDFSVRGRHSNPVKASPKKRPTSKLVKSLIDSKENSSVGGGLKPGSKTLSDPAAPAQAGLTDSTFQNTNTNTSAHPNANTKPRLIVKFEFPVRRLKRSASMKTKKGKVKVSRQESSGSHDGSHNGSNESSDDGGYVAEERPESPPVQSFGAENPALTALRNDVTNLSSCDSLSESELFI